MLSHQIVRILFHHHYILNWNWIFNHIGSIYYRMLKIAQLILVEGMGTFEVLLHSLNYLSTTNNPPIMHFLYLNNSTLMSFVSGWNIPLRLIIYIYVLFPFQCSTHFSLDFDSMLPFAHPKVYLRAQGMRRDLRHETSSSG